MSTTLSILEKLKKDCPSSYYKDRIISELQYGLRVSNVNGGKYDSLIGSAAQFLLNKYKQDDCITKFTALEAEKSILEISQDAKKFKMICAAHAHIDMNWMWRWDETVSITLETFRTMLNLMDEYPDFTFSQSQASVYRIIEEHEPDMLNKIKQRVKEGRWEVTASTWVENDKNMPNAESLSRHILYTKQYLSKLLDIDPKSLEIDFEPDTFGHSANVPEVLSKGGVKYYYHCRGYEEHNIYRWHSPSGASVLVYREPLWYNSDINPSMAMYVPEFCTKHNIDTMLKVYGVGDHGGGPTRRDIERIIDMNTWPIFPEISFGTFREYFKLIEKQCKDIPEVKDELNFVFTGCYTTQTRIKMANRIGEAVLNEAETFSSISSLAKDTHYPSQRFAKAWQNVLFNQFHDIIPGSGIKDTREYAMGLFQNTMAIANTERSKALRTISSMIDTSNFISTAPSKDTVSEGAGVGYGIKDFGLSTCERGRDNIRIFHLFNSTPFHREEVVELIIWDWNGDLDRIVFKDSFGEETPYQIEDSGFNDYWGHKFIRILIKAKVPPLGYSTYIMDEKEPSVLSNVFPKDPRVERENSFVLENNFVRAQFSPMDGSITSLIDKETGEELIPKDKPSGIFRLIEEDERRGMTAWIVGRYMSIKNINEGIRLSRVFYKSENLRQSLCCEVQFRSSKLKYTISLDNNSKELKYNVECDWHEIGKVGSGVPQLNFYMPLGYKCNLYKYDIPMGIIERKAMDMDVPGNSFILGVREDMNKKSLMIITDSKYGFRGTDNSLSVTLIRSSFDPDPYPELGIHKFSFAISLVHNRCNKYLIENSLKFVHGINPLASLPHKGTLPLSKSFIGLEEGTIAVSAIKMGELEDGKNKLIIRVYETDGLLSTVKLKLFKCPLEAYFVDINENKLIDGDTINIFEDKVSFHVKPYSLSSICIKF